MKSCLPLLLLACLFTTTAVGGFGALWGYFVFPHNENPSLKLFYNVTSHAIEYEFDPELCTNFDNDNYNYYSDNLNLDRKIKRDRQDFKRKIKEDLQDFIRSTFYAGNIYNDMRFWMVVPCGLAALLSAKLLMAASCTTTILATTHVLYSSVSIVIMSLVMGILYQYKVAEMMRVDVNDDATTTFPWITASYVALFLLAMALVVISVFELRRRNVVWPTIHPTQLFTGNCIALVARLTLGVYCCIFYDMGPLRSGTSTDMCKGMNDYYYNRIHFKYLDYYSLPAALLLLHGAVVAGEAVVSLLLGSCSTCLMGLDGLTSVIGYGFVAVVSSPAFVAFVFTHKGWRQDNSLMALAVASCVVALVHAPLRRKMTTPPAIVTQLATAISDITQGTTTTATAIISARDYLSGVLRKKVINSSRFSFGIIVMSGTGLVLAALNCENWGNVVMVVGHGAILCRAIPALLAQYHSCHQQLGSDMQVLVQYLLESLLLLVGAIGGFCSWHLEATTIIAGLISFGVIFAQGKVIAGLPSLSAAAGIIAEGEKRIHSVSDTDKNLLIHDSNDSTSVTNDDDTNA